MTSIVTITGKDMLKKYKKKPLFGNKYLVLFEDVKVFEQNAVYINFETMFVVVQVETNGQLEDAKFVCTSAKLPFKVYLNKFTKDDAIKLMRAQAKTELSNAFCEAVIRQTGLNPLRITTAMDVCSSLGYTASVVERYVDKWTFTDLHKVIDALLGIGTKTAVKSSCLYLHQNRYWYNRYTKKRLLDEIETIYQIYCDKMAGLVSNEDMLSYLEEKKLTRNKVVYALRLYETVSIASIFALREFIKSATPLEVALRLIGR